MSINTESAARRTVRVTLPPEDGAMASRNAKKTTNRDSAFGDATEFGITRRIMPRITNRPTSRMSKGSRRGLSHMSSQGSVLTNSGEAMTNSFIEDMEIDTEESEFQLQYTHISLENVLTDAEHNKPLRATAEVPLSEKFLERSAAFLRRVRERLKGDACKRLLRCIQQVIQMRKQNRVQVLLQHMFLVNAGLIDNRASQLPPSMESPRTTVHVATRMQHFERIRDEGNKVVHYLHPRQLPRARLGTPLTVAGLSDDSRASTPSKRLVRSRDAKLPAAQYVRVGTPGTLSAMADKARTVGRIGLPPTDVTLVGEEGEFDGDWQNFVASWVGKPYRSSALENTANLTDLQMHPRQDDRLSHAIVDVGRKGSKQKEAYRAKRVVEYGSEPPPPELSGATGGFLSSSIDKRKIGLKSLTNKDKLAKAWSCEEKVADIRRPKKSKTQYNRKIPPLALFDQKLFRSESSEPSERMLQPVTGCSSISTDLARRRQDIRCSLKSSSTGGLKTRLSSSFSPKSWNTSDDKEHDQGYDARSIDLCNVNIDNFTQFFMLSRGLEKSHIPSVRMDVEYRRMVRKVFRPESPIHRELPLPGPSLWESSIDRMTMIDRCNTPEVAYARECIHGKVSPSIIKFLAEPSSKLDLGQYLIGDDDLQALLNAMISQQSDDKDCNKSSEKISVTDISFLGNRRLTDDMLSQFMSKAILGDKKAGIKPCVGLVRSLNVADCIGFRSKSLDTLCSLLNRGNELRNLEELNIQGIEVAATAWTTITESFRNSWSLRKLGLARTGCGKLSQLSCCAVADLIVSGACKNLRVLDISGNHFHHQGCVALGEALKKAEDKFEEFDLSHNAGCASDLHDGPSWEQTSFNPIMHVLEALGETTVKRVAFADCQLTYEEDCILEDSVDSSDITHLQLADNPHGEQGLRCIVRMLARKRKSERQIEYLGLDTIRNAPLQPDTLKLDLVDPSAKYSLRLRKPQHRSVLKMLLKRSEDCGGHFACFEDVKLDGKPMQNGLEALCSKRMDRGGDDWQIPWEGILSFAFQLPPSYNPRDSLKDVFRKFERGQKLKVDFDGFARLLRLYRSIQDQRSQMVMLCAMGRDIVLKLCHIQYFAEQSRDIFTFILVTLLPTLEEQTSRSVLFDLVNSAGAASQQIRREAKSLLYFNALHPDDHYVLSLPNLVDRGTAQRCLVISNWVRHQSIALGRLDLSEHGNYECLRHTYLSKHKFVFDSATWQLPDEGTLVFDMVLPRLPLDAKQCLDQLALKDLIQALMASPCNFQHKLCALRLVAHRLVLKPKDLVSIVKKFPSCRPDNPIAATYGFRPRVEAFIILYNRTLYHALVVSPTVLYNMLLFQREEAQEIRDRLGWIHTFDVVNVHSQLSNLGSRHGPLDMHSHDGWLIVKLLISISHSESGVNFTDCRWSPKDSLYLRGYAFCIPKEWVPDPPRYGHFTCNFQSRPEEINWLRRDELAVEYLGWTYPPPESSR